MANGQRGALLHVAGVTVPQLLELSALPLLRGHARIRRLQMAGVSVWGRRLAGMFVISNVRCRIVLL